MGGNPGVTLRWEPEPLQFTLRPTARSPHASRSAPRAMATRAAAARRAACCSATRPPRGCCPASRKGAHAGAPAWTARCVARLECDVDPSLAVAEWVKACGWAAQAAIAAAHAESPERAAASAAALSVARARPAAPSAPEASRSASARAASAPAAAAAGDATGTGSGVDGPTTRRGADDKGTHTSRGQRSPLAAVRHWWQYAGASSAGSSGGVAAAAAVAGVALVCVGFALGVFAGRGILAPRADSLGVSAVGSAAAPECPALSVPLAPEAPLAVGAAAS